MVDISNKLLEKRENLANNLSKLRELSLVELGIRSGYKKEEAEIMSKESFKVYFSGRNDVKLYQGTEKTLKRLKEKYTLGVITNGNANLKKIGINHYFSFNISAENMNVSKPDPKFFEAAVAETSLNAHEICHVGDNPINDVQGSLNVGMKAIWFNKKKLNWPLNERPDFEEIYSLQELERTLENFN